MRTIDIVKLYYSFIDNLRHGFCLIFLQNLINFFLSLFLFIYLLTYVLVFKYWIHKNGSQICPMITHLIIYFFANNILIMIFLFLSPLLLSPGSSGRDAAWVSWVSEYQEDWRFSYSGVLGPQRHGRGTQLDSETRYFLIETDPLVFSPKSCSLQWSVSTLTLRRKLHFWHWIGSEGEWQREIFTA